MASFNRSSTTSCRTAIVSVTLSCINIEVFDVEEYPYLEI